MARDKELSLKAKGLLCLIMSLPEDWDYTTKGLITQVKESKDSVYATVNELIKKGYCKRELVKEKGRFKRYEYTFYEIPHTEIPHTENPYTEIPHTENKDKTKYRDNKLKNEINKEESGLNSNFSKEDLKRDVSHAPNNAPPTTEEPKPKYKAKESNQELDQLVLQYERLFKRTVTLKEKRAAELSYCQLTKQEKKGLYENMGKYIQETEPKYLFKTLTTYVEKAPRAIEMTPNIKMVVKETF